MVMMKVFLVLYQFSPVAAGFGDALSAIVLQFPSEKACHQAIEIFNSIGKGPDVRYAPGSPQFRAECTATNPR